MSQQQHIDPALAGPPPPPPPSTHSPSSVALSAGASRYEPAPPPLPFAPPPPPQQHPPSSNVGQYPPATASNPYYNGYLAVQPPTPTQPSTGAPSIASPSNQASPQDATPQYQQLAQDGIDHSHLADPNDGQHPDDAKRPRACEACRGLKVRCDQDPAHPELPCRRCAKAGRACIITAPSRKRQKKADSRVAELEKKLDHLTAVLQQSQQNGQIPYGPQFGQAPTADMQGRAYAQAAQQLQQYGPSPEEHHDSAPMQPPAKRRRTDEHMMESPATAAPGSSASHAADMRSEQDLSDRLREHNRSHESALQARSQQHVASASREFVDKINNLVSPQLGAQIFDRYCERLAPHMPAVVFPPGTQAEQIWREQPILFAVILSAASYGLLPPSVSRQLAHEATQEIANLAIVHGVKSIELIQALQVLALWYKPPENTSNTNFYQIIHMAAVMSIDLGLGKRGKPAGSRVVVGAPQPEWTPDPPATISVIADSAEAKRAFLACYYLCASASMVLRRPTLVHWTRYMEECVEFLENSPEALPSDKLFCQHLKIQHICDEVGVQFSMNDTGASVSITDPKISYALNVLENDLKQWKSKIPADLKSHHHLRLFEHSASLYLHEIALHFNHNVEDFRIPFTEESLKTVNSSSEKLAQHQVSALEACRIAAQGILDCTLACDQETVLALPVLLFFVQCTYAIVVLIKLHVAVTTPGSEISKVMSAEDIGVDRRLDRLIDLYTTPFHGQDTQHNGKVMLILTVLREWFTKHKENVAAQARGEALPNPMQPQPNPQNRQTPLHLLAQTATNVKQEQHNQPQSSSTQAWVVNNPYPGEYEGAANQPQGPYPPVQQVPNGYPQGPIGPYTIGTADFDAGNPVLWGSGLQQAMDLNLADMTGVTGGGIDGLFFGNGLVAFDYNGEPPPMQ